MSAQILGDTPTAFKTAGHGQRNVIRALVAGLAALALLGATVSPAAADISADTVVAVVGVEGAISLSGLTDTFRLNGAPGATVDGEGAVDMTVTTNNLAGYTVTVRSSTATLLPTATGNADSIPIGNLRVRKHVPSPVPDTDPPFVESGAFTSMSTSTVTVGGKASRSAEAGDFIANDYEVTIPFVNLDTYRATLTYTATTL